MAAPAASSPRIRVAAVILDGESILLVRHHKDDRDYYLLPGGGVEPGETLRAALVREVAEETGIICEPSDILFVNDSIDPAGARHVVQITFTAAREATDAALRVPDARVCGSDFVPLDTLAELDLRPAIGGELVRALSGTDANVDRYLGAVWTD